MSNDRTTTELTEQLASLVCPVWASQWELICHLAFPSYFLYNTKFQQADCSACYLLLHAGSLLALFFDPEDEGDIFL
jgi:hypothetical protein